MYESALQGKMDILTKKYKDVMGMKKKGWDWIEDVFYCQFFASALILQATKHSAHLHVLTTYNYLVTFLSSTLCHFGK